MLKDLENFPDTVIVWGENETAEFKGQSNVFSKKLIEFGVNVKTFEVPSRNHFDVILDLTNRNTLLGCEFYKLIAKVKS
jgi:arylformamidase